MAYDIGMVKRVYQGDDFDKLINKIERDILNTRSSDKKKRLKDFLRELNQ